MERNNDTAFAGKWWESLGLYREGSLPTNLGGGGVRVVRRPSFGCLNGLTHYRVSGLYHTTCEARLVALTAEHYINELCRI
jgi:hypothetical protein